MILDKLMQRMANPLENPKIPLNDPRVAEYLSPGTASSAGVAVTNNTSLSYPAYWRGINLVSQSVGKTPTFVLRNLPGGGREKAKNHPSYRLLKRQPNRDMSPMVFKQTLQAHALMHGNGYAAIFRDGLGLPDELIILDPTQTYPKRENGVLVYETKINEKDVTLAARNAIHIKGLSYDGMIGYSVIEILKESVGLGLAAQKYGSVFFRNNGRPGWLVEVPYKFKDAEAAKDFRNRMGDVHNTIDNAHRPALLEGGASIKEFTTDNEAAQFLETRDFEVRQIANIIGVPPHKLGDDSRTSHSSLEQENQSMLNDSIDPWFVKSEEEYEAKLLSQQEQQDEEYSVRFERKALIRADIGARFSAYEIGIRNRIILPNEAREKEDMNPIEGGDEFPPVAGAAPAEESEQEPETEPEEDDDRNDKVLAAHRDCIHDTAERLIRKIGYKARSAAKKPGQFNHWVENLADEHRQEFIDRLTPTIKACELLVVGSTSSRTSSIVNDMFAALLGDLDAAAGESRNGNLPVLIDNLFTEHERIGAGVIADMVIRKVTKYEVTL